MAFDEKAREAEARVVADVVAKAKTPEIVTLGNDHGVQIAFCPPGSMFASVKGLLDEYLPAPERMKGTTKLYDARSFIAWVIRFKDPDSIIFANPTGPSLTAVIDYDREVNTRCTTEEFADALLASKPKKPKGDALPEPIPAHLSFKAKEGGGAPRFGEHRAVYTFPLSDEWLAWTSRSGKNMTQTDFAAWLEDRVADLRSPTDIGPLTATFQEQLQARFATPQELMKLSKGLEIRQKSVVKEIRLSESGEANVTYINEHQDESGAPLKVPTAFLLGLRVFKSGLPWEVCVRLRYRLNGQSISWQFELYRTDKILQTAFEEECATVQRDTGVQLLVGDPG